MKEPTNAGNSDPEDAYEQYREWLPFVRRLHSFVRATAGDLGYNPEQLEKVWRS